MKIAKMNNFAPPSSSNQPITCWKDPKFNSEEVIKLKSKEETNVLIIRNKRKFVAHSTILRKLGFFDRLLRELYEDKTTQQIIIPRTGCEIKLDFCDTDEVILDMFIKYLYTGELNYIDSEENVNKILLEAKNFGLTDVVEHLLNCKVDNLNEDNWLSFLRLIGNQYPIHKDSLYLHLYTDINSSFIHSTNFLSLELNELKSMLTATHYYPFRSELNKLEGVVTWISYSSDRKAHLNELVNLIQLVKIDRDYLTYIFEKNSKLLRENKMFKIYLKTVSSKSIKVNGAVQHFSGSSKSGRVENTSSKSKSKSVGGKKSKKKNLQSSAGIKVEATDHEHNIIEYDDDDEELEILYENVQTIYKNVSVPVDPSMTIKTKDKRGSENNDHYSELEDNNKRIKIEPLSIDQVEELTSSINIDLGEINIKEEIMDTEDEDIKPITNETGFKLENVSSICSSSTVSYDDTKDDDGDSGSTGTGTDREIENQSKDEDVFSIDSDEVFTVTTRARAEHKENKNEIYIVDSDDDVIITTPVSNDVDLPTNSCSPLSSSSTKLLFFKKSKNVKSYLMTYSFKNPTHKKIAETNDIVDIGIEESTIVNTGTKVFFIGGTLPTGVHASIKEKLMLLKTGSDRVKSLSVELLNTKKALIPVESWKDEPKIQTPKYNFPALVVRNFLYIFGGCSGDTVFNSVEKLDLDNTTSGWTDNEEHLEFFRDSAGAAHLGDYIYIVGGSGYAISKPPDTKIKSLRDVERFNLKTKTQEIVASMEKKRSHVCVVAFRNKIFALGGTDRLMDRRYATTEVYDPEKNVWEKGPRMNHPRAGGYAIVLDDTIYVIGGNVNKNDNDKSTKQTIEMLDVKSNNWVLLHSKLPAYPTFLFNISFLNNSDESQH